MTGAEPKLANLPLSRALRKYAPLFCGVSVADPSSPRAPVSATRLDVASRYSSRTTVASHPRPGWKLQLTVVVLPNAIDESDTLSEAVDALVHGLPPGSTGTAPAGATTVTATIRPATCDPARARAHLPRNKRIYIHLPRSRLRRAA